MMKTEKKLCPYCGEKLRQSDINSNNDCCLYCFEEWLNELSHVKKEEVEE